MSSVDCQPISVWRRVICSYFSFFLEKIILPQRGRILRPIFSGFLFGFFFAAIAFYGNAIASGDTSIFVSNVGNDLSLGTKASPVKTVRRAQELLRSLVKEQSSNINIVFRQGEYFLQEPLVLTQEDSGRNGFKVVFKSFDNEVAVFSGCKKVPEPTKGSDFQTLSGGGREPSVVFVDRDFGVRARYPNKTDDDRASEFIHFDVGDNKKLAFSLSDSFPSAVLGKESFDTVVINSHWYHSRVKLGTADFDLIGDRLISKGPIVGFKKLHKFYAGSFGYIEGGRALIDTVNEWYYDSTGRNLYVGGYKSAVGRQLLVEIPVTASLIKMVGTQDEPVSHIDLRSLVFQCGDWSRNQRTDLYLTQFSQVVGGDKRFKSSDHPSGLISISNARDIEIRDVVVRNTAGSGIQFYENVDDFVLKDSVIYNVGANGIEVDVVPEVSPAPEKQSQRFLIDRNYIFRVGRIYSNGGGIFLGNVSDAVVSRNTLRDMPYSCIQLGHQPKEKMFVGVRNVVIKDNIFSKCMLLHDDGGAIYTLGGIHVGTLIEGNEVSDIKRNKWAGEYPVEFVYLDNYTSGVVVRNNTLKGGRVAELNRSEGNLIQGR